MRTQKEISEALDRAETAEGDALVDLLGEAIDDSVDLGDLILLARANRIIENSLAQDSGSSHEAILHYFRGNIWGAIRHIQHIDLHVAWNWESDVHEQEILSFRRCVTHPGYKALGRHMRARALTNLGTVLGNTGRCVEALEFYDRALAIVPNFGMAQGNKGICLLTYAREHYDSGHRQLFARFAADLLGAALQQPLDSREAYKGFTRHLDSARALGQESGFYADLNNESFLGETEDERSFRRWCVENRLFLNPLNDLGPFSIASYDFLHLPTMAVKAEYGTGFHGFYNEMKQEYSAARWLFYQAIKGNNPAFIDAGLGLLDTMAGAVYGIRTQKLRLAMRSAYSIFDKISVFINHALGLKQKAKYNFRSVWYEPRNRRTLRTEFIDRENLTLRALFWLSKDLLTSPGDGLHQVLEPDARDIAEIRNALEHRYLEVRADGWWAETQCAQLVTTITQSGLQDKTLRVLKLARAALIYLSLAMGREQELREPVEGRAVPRWRLRPIEGS